MRWISIALLAGAGLVAFKTPASAADLARAYKAPPPLPAPIYNWTGFYVGASAGARWADPEWQTTALCPLTPACAAVIPPPDPTTANTTLRSSSFRVGGYAGYNWQVAPNWVVGVEADVGWGNKNDRTVTGIPGTFGFAFMNSPNGDTASVKETWDASIRGRAGFLITPALLLYGTAGIAWTRVEASASCTVNSVWCGFPPHLETYATTRIGWTIGGGGEAMFTGRWLVRAEYRYADYGTFTHTFFPPGTSDEFTASVRLRSHIANAGVAYKF